MTFDTKVYGCKINNVRDSENWCSMADMFGMF